MIATNRFLRKLDNFLFYHGAKCFISSEETQIAKRTSAFDTEGKLFIFAKEFAKFVFPIRYAIGNERKRNHLANLIIHKTKTLTTLKLVEGNNYALNFISYIFITELGAKRLQNSEDSRVVALKSILISLISTMFGAFITLLIGSFS